MKLILIRHGNTEANEKHLYCGSTDLPLSDAGRAALLERKKTVGVPASEGFRVLTSGMKRCKETLALLCGEVPHETDAAFREMDCGVFEMRSYEEMKDDPAYLAWITGDNEANVCPGGESGQIMTDR
ncbi:MAG: histidine phosphatase family protein, partial [Clostridia bacterium]|nr:histidine phosphatase family protein [Clostridia bacterium]